MSNTNSGFDIFRQDNTIWKAITKPKTVSETIQELGANRRLVEKTIACPTHHTLCWALNELAKYEQREGTEAFCDYVVGVERGGYIGIQLYTNHHSVIGGGNPNDKNIEDTEFLTLDFPHINYGYFSQDLGIEVDRPTFPLYVDIEYVEVGYALYKKYRGGAFVAYAGYNTLKLLVKLFQKSGNSFGYEPNKYGFILGTTIASSGNNLQGFVEQWCVGGTCRL